MITKPTMLKVIVAVLAGLACGNAVNPINKVISMLEKMQSDIIEEGKEAQAMYTEFAGMCEGRSRELHNEIKSGKAKGADLKAAIEKAVADVAVLEEKISDAAAGTSDAEAELKKATAMRKREASDFNEEQAELTKTISTIERAITVIEKQGSSASLAQLANAQSITQVLETMAEAEAINADDAMHLTSLVQNSKRSSEDEGDMVEEESDEAQTAAGKSSNIIDTLEALLDKTQKQLEDARGNESKSKNAYELLKQSLTAKIKTITKEMGESKKSKAATGESQATAEGNLEVTMKDLHEDEKELAELHRECLDKATAYEEDMSSHNEESKALAEAKKILLETTGGAKKTLDLAQESFLQVASKAKSQGQGAQALHDVRRIALTYHNSALIELANHIEKVVRSSALTGGDPFGKVKAMVTSMIHKLEKEAESEASKKAYCDKEMGETSTSKEDKEGAIEKVNIQIDVLSSDIKALKGEVARLEKELGSLARTQAEMDKLRFEEKAIYNKNKPVLEQGLDGVKKALAVLRDYFASDGGGGAAGGIIGMLEVVESDFSKGLAEMTSSEESAQAEYDAATKENKVAQAVKEKDVKYKTAEYVSYEKSVTELESDKTGVKSELDAVLEYFASIKKDCVAKPDSFEERAKRREDEMAGLREALNTLGADASLVQTRLRGRAQASMEPDASED
jgi:hypothetical protein